MGLPRFFLLLLALLLLVASPAFGARGMEVAISDEGAMVDGSDGNALAAYQTAQSLNATRMRILVEWSRVSDADSATPTANPDYNWGPIDNAINAAAAYGMRTQLVLAGPAPAYAAGLAGNPPLRIAKPNPKLYAAFVSAAATHFKGRVDRYSLWNEPNYPSWLAPKKQSPKIYRALYTAGYKAIKAADRSAQVLIGETVPYGGKASKNVSGIGTPPLAWLRKLACVDAKYKRVGHCKPLKADGYAHHPYEFTMAPTAKAKAFKDDNAPIQAISRLRLALNKLRSAHALSTPKGRPLDIYLTESGYFVNGNRAVAAPDRAKWLPQQFQVAARQPRVREMLQYNVFVPDNTTFTTGLLDLSGAPLPEYGTLLSWTQSAASSGLIKRNTGPISLPPAPNDGTSATPGGGSGGGGGNGSGGAAAPPSGSPGGGLPSVGSPPPGCKIAVASVCVVPA